MRGIDSSYAWWRLAASVTLSTVGGIGMWSLAVAMPVVQGDLGITRADISFAYTMNMRGFFAGGVLVGRLVDRRGIVVASIASAVGLAAGFALATLTSSLILFAAAEIAVSTSSDTRRRNPVPRTIAIERKRCLIIPKNPPLFGSSTFQIVFSAAFS